MEISEEKYFEEKIPLETYDKTKENAIFFRKFLKGRCEIYNAVFPPPIARRFFTKHGFVACCRLRQSAVVVKRISAPSEISSGTVDLFFQFSFTQLVKFLMG
jgi:hypothetical protein